MDSANVVRRLYHFGRSVSDLARACRLMGEGAYDRLHARTQVATPRQDANDLELARKLWDASEKIAAEVTATQRPMSRVARASC